MPARLLQSIGGRVVAEPVSDGVQSVKAYARFQVRLCIGEGFECLIRGHQGLIRVTLALFSGRVGDGDREQAGPMIVDVGIEVLAMEGIEQAGPALRDMGMAQELTHDMAVLSFHQGSVIAVPGAGLGKLDTQRLQQPGDLAVDIFRAVVGMESQDHERDALQQVFQGRDEIVFTDFLDTDHDLELGHLIYPALI